MADPKKVEEQGKKAEDLQKQLIDGKTGKSKKKDKEDKDSQAPPAEEQNKEPESPKEGETPAPEESSSIANKTDQGSPEPGQRPEDFEQKYRVLQGKYDTEISQLRDELKKATQTITNLNSIISSVQQPKAEAEQGPQPSQQPEAELKMEDFEGYGTEMSSLVNLVNTQAKEIRDLKAHLNQVNESVSETKEGRFFSELTKTVPDWEQINKDPRWIEWLGEEDPLYGVSRQALLNDAQQKLDIKRVTAFFNTFKRAFNAETPKVEGPSSNPPGQPARKQQLEGQIVPEVGRAPTEAPVVAGQQPTVTREQFNKAVKDYQTGRITEEEFAKISNGFQQSIAQGSIR